MVKSMNSTMESFSENAWDNYQDPPYHVTSDDPTEERLDDSALQWEHNLEFEEDFHLGYGLPRTIGDVRPRDKRMSVSGELPSLPTFSNLDLTEEFPYIMLLLTAIFQYSQS